MCLLYLARVIFQSFLIMNRLESIFVINRHVLESLRVTRPSQCMTQDKSARIRLLSVRMDMLRVDVIKVAIVGTLVEVAVTIFE